MPDEFLHSGVMPVRLGRPPLGERSMTRKERKHKEVVKRKANRLKHLAVLDMETDPFNGEEVFPYSRVI
jgi:hypothetical protein